MLLTKSEECPTCQAENKQQGFDYDMQKCANCGETLIETIIWRPIKSSLPDSDTTVLLFNAAASEPVWPGYRDDGTGQWLYVDGSIAEPSHWAKQPGGPEHA